MKYFVADSLFLITVHVSTNAYYEISRSWQ